MEGLVQLDRSLKAAEKTSQSRRAHRAERRARDKIVDFDEAAGLAPAKEETGFLPALSQLLSFVGETQFITSRVAAVQEASPPPERSNQCWKSGGTEASKRWRAPVIGCTKESFHACNINRSGSAGFFAGLP